MFYIGLNIYFIMNGFLFSHSLALSFLLIACGNTDKAFQKEARIKAAANYSKYCAGCHYNDFGWFKNRQWKHGKNQKDIFNSIKTGYPDNGMPSFESTLSGQEMKNLANYIITAVGSNCSVTGSQKQIAVRTGKFIFSGCR